MDNPNSRGLHVKRKHGLSHKKHTPELTRSDTSQMASELKYRTIFDHAGDAIFIHDLNGKMLDVNQVACDRMGFTHEELLRMTLIDMDSPEHAKLVPERIQKLITNKHIVFETCHVRKDGTFIPTEISRRLIEYDGQQAMLSICRDITERKEAQNELQDIIDVLRKEILERIRLEASHKTLSQEFEAILDTIPDTVILLSPDLKVLWANRSAARNVDREIDAIVGLPCYQVWFCRDKACPDCHAISTVKSGKADIVEIIGPSGRVVESRAVPIKDEYGSVIKVLMLRRDITEKRKLEDEIIKSSKLESIGLLAGGIAHDINNALTGIILQAALAKYYADPVDDIYAVLVDMEKSCAAAKGLPQQLLSFSKGGMPVKKLGAIADVLDDIVSFALSGSSVAYSLSVPEDLWVSEFDQVQITQAINNIVINARDSMLKGGKIEVRTENVLVGAEMPLPVNHGSYVMISVRDYGIGIPVENIPKIFDPFFTTKQMGSGIGLATAYTIVKRHGGHITVESIVGEGSTFRIFLPAVEGKLQAKGRNKGKPVSGRGKVLVMDDEGVILLDLSRFLTKLGYEVHSASNGSDAVILYSQAHAKGRPFDVVVMDFTVPGGMGGRECFDELRKIEPQVKAVLTSGYFDETTITNLREYGFHEVLRKPYEIEELSRILHELTYKG